VRFDLLAGTVLSLAASLPLQAQTEPPSGGELRFHRVYLKNGNVVDGQLIQQTPQTLLLRLRGGEMSIRMDSIDRVEFVKMKSVDEKPTVVKPPTNPETLRPGPVKPPAAPKNPAAIRLDSQTDEQVQTLINDYLRGDVEQKGLALSKMIALGGDVPAYLVSVISRFDRDQVPLVLTAVAQTKDASVVPVMGAAIEGGDSGLRLNLVMALGMLGAPAALPYLTPSLRDKDAAIRTAAVTAISVIQSPEAFDVLLSLVTDPDREARTRTIGALNDMAAKNSRKKDLGDALATGLQNSDGEVRLDLIFALGHGGHSTSWNSLLTYLTDESVPVRQATATALMELAVPGSAEGILGAAGTEKDSKVRAILAKTFQKLGMVHAGGTLISWLADPNVDTKNAVRTSLAALAGQNLGNDVEKWQAWWEKAKPQ
jgi:HEAT repeat protein